MQLRSIVLIGGFCLQLLSYGLVQGQTDRKPDVDARNAAIANVVSRQISAFQSGDAELAYSFASPNIKARFLNPTRFNAMVKKSYGMIFDPQIHKLEEVIERNGNLFQKALFVGKKNVTYRAYYQMQKQDDGSWKINGVSLVLAEDQFT